MAVSLKPILTFHDQAGQILCWELIENRTYSKAWLQQPPRIATTYFQRPLFCARTVSYRNCTANSLHLRMPCATSDLVFHGPSASFPCVERPCTAVQNRLFCEVPQQKSDGKRRSAQAEKPTLAISRFERCLWSWWFFFFPVISFVENFALLQCVEPANKGPLSTKTAFVCTKGWSLCTGFTVFWHSGVVRYCLSNCHPDNHFVGRAGWKAKMGSIELSMQSRIVHSPYWKNCAVRIKRRFFIQSEIRSAGGVNHPDSVLAKVGKLPVKKALRWLDGGILRNSRKF